MGLRQAVALQSLVRVHVPGAELDLSAPVLLLSTELSCCQARAQGEAEERGRSKAGDQRGSL